MNFRKIDKSNYMDCILLQVDESQRHFVADNARSLIEATFEEGLYTLGIYHEEDLDYFKEHHNANEIYISVSLENFVARKLYSNIGFEEIKEIEYTFDGQLDKEMQMVKYL